MRMKLYPTMAAVFLMLFPDQAEACRRCSSRLVQRQVIVQDFRQAVTIPFVVPVGVPVATAQVGLSYGYNYQMGQQRYSALTTDELADRVAQQVMERFSQIEGFRRMGLSASATTVHCAKCHVGSVPKGGFSLRLLSPEKRYKAVRMVMTHKMPKGKTLTEEERSAVIHDLLELEPAPRREVLKEAVPDAPGP